MTSISTGPKTDDATSQAQHQPCTCARVQLLQVLAYRQRPYCLDLDSTTFNETTYVEFLILLLRHEAPEAVVLRNCGCPDMPRWKRLEAHTLLSYHLCRDDAKTTSRCVLLPLRALPAILRVHSRPELLLCAA